MALSLTSPENSFIQFYPVEGAGIETCNQVMQKCLPIHYGYDFAFQLYVSGAVDEWVQDNYVVKITDSEGNVVSDEQPFVWGYDAVANVSWANLDTAFDITDLIVLGNGACANFKIFVNIYNYAYSSIDLSGGVSMTIKLFIDGVLTTIGVLNAGDDMDDLAALINAYFVANSITALATHTFGNNLNIQSTDGHLYGAMEVHKGVISVSYNGVQTIATSTPYFISNCIQYIEDTCWTTIVKYKGDDNQFGFNYALDPNFYNSARLDLYLDNPVPVDDENYFTLSDGRKKVLSARYEKEYEAHIDFADEQRHFALHAAIKHDTILMGRITANQEYSCEGKHDISWLNKPGTNLDSAQGSFRARPIPYYEVNSNCVST